MAKTLLLGELFLVRWRFSLVVTSLEASSKLLYTSSRISTEMGDRSRVCRQATLQLSLVIPAWVGEMSTSDG